METDAPSLHVVGERTAAALAYARVAAWIGAAVLALGAIAPEIAPGLRGAIEADAMLVAIVVTAPVWLALGALAREREDNTLHKAAIGCFSCQLLGWTLSAWAPEQLFAHAGWVLLALVLLLAGLGTFLFAPPFRIGPSRSEAVAKQRAKRSAATEAALAASADRPSVMIGDKTLSPATREALANSAARPRRRAEKPASAMREPKTAAGAGAALVGLWVGLKLFGKAKFLTKWSLYRGVLLATRGDPAGLLRVVWNATLLVATALLTAVGVRLVRSEAALGRGAVRAGKFVFLVALHQIVFRVVHLGWEGELDANVLRTEHVLGMACHGVLWWQVARWFAALLEARSEAVLRAAGGGTGSA